MRYVALPVPILLALLVLAQLPIPVAASTVRLLDLPEGYIPLGVVLVGGQVWVASYTYGAVSRVDFASGTVEHYYIEGEPDTDYTWMFTDLAVDASGRLWIASQSGRLVVFDPVSKEFAVVLEGVEGISTLCYCLGRLWFPVPGKLYYYNPATGEVGFYPFSTPWATYGSAVCGGGSVWFTDTVNGRVYAFNISTYSFRVFTGFNRPVGVYYLDGYVYVAENVRSVDPGTPAIAVLDVGSGSVSRVPVRGSPYGVVAFKVLTATVVAYSSSGEDPYLSRGIGIVSGGSVTFFNITVPAVYKLVYDAEAGAIYFTFYGSASGVGQFSEPPQVGEYLLPSSATIAVAVNTYPTTVAYQTSLSLEANATTVFVGDAVEFTAVLRYANGTKAGQPVGAGKPIKLYVNGTEVAEGVTDVNGSWRYVHVFNDAGIYVVKAVFEGGTFSPYYSASSSSELVVEVREHVAPTPPTPAPPTAALYVSVLVATAVATAAVSVYLAKRGVAG